MAGGTVVKVRSIKTSGRVLRVAAAPVTEFDSRLQRLVRVMWNTLQRNQGVGLAAPQVGIGLQLAVVASGDGEPWVLINPELLGTDGGTRGEQEGCLSLPGKRFYVVRPENVVLEAADETGTRRRLRATGFKARVVQHELDHLSGILINAKVRR